MSSPNTSSRLSNISHHISKDQYPSSTMGGGLQDKLLCILPWPEQASSTARIKERYPDIEITYITQRDARDLPKDIFLDKTVLVTLGGIPKTREECPKLELVHLFSAGADHAVKQPLFINTDITFTTSSGIHGPQISEWVIMTALTRSHSYDFMYESQKARKWDRGGIGMVHDMVGRRLGILGYGSIGRQVANIGKAMGMDVVAYTASPRDTPEKRRDAGFVVPGTGDPDGTIPSAWFSGLDKESLHKFLAQDIDILVVGVPLTPDTKHLLSTPEFEILKAHRPVFISNIARGAIIDQKALVAALHDGTVAGAALDVTDPEPLPPDDPLWTAPNVTITPHTSGLTSSYAERAFQVLEANLDRRSRGETLINVIDRRRGY